jgi:hypothetical protein
MYSNSRNSRRITTTTTAPDEPNPAAAWSSFRFYVMETDENLGTTRANGLPHFDLQT